MMAPCALAALGTVVVLLMAADTAVATPLDDYVNKASPHYK
jgi:hypothetical protein